MFDFVSFIPRAIMQGIPLLFGSTGETLTEKSGNLNLGIAGIMYVGGISGVIGAFLYEQAAGGAAGMNGFLAIMIPLLSCLLGSLLMGLLYCFLTVTLRANQNVTGLAMTTFGVGFGNFMGGSLIKLTGSEVPSIALSATNSYFSKSLPLRRSSAGSVRSSCPTAFSPTSPWPSRSSRPTCSSTRAWGCTCAPSAKIRRRPTLPASTSISISTSPPASAA